MQAGSSQGGAKENRGISMKLERLFLAAACGALCAGAVSAGDIYGYTDAQGVLHLTNVPAAEPYKVILRSPRDRQATEPARRRYEARIASVASQLSLDPALIHAVVMVESGYNPDAVSPKGAVGLMQLMPDTARRYGVSDPRAPEENLLAGARYLRDLLIMFDDNLQLALAAYNAGENAVLKYGSRIPPYRETQDYVRKVQTLYQRFAGTRGA